MYFSVAGVLAAVAASALMPNHDQQEARAMQPFLSGVAYLYKLSGLMSNVASSRCCCLSIVMAHTGTATLLTTPVSCNCPENMTNCVCQCHQTSPLVFIGTL